jgi:hypothetical protein
MLAFFMGRQQVIAELFPQLAQSPQRIHGVLRLPAQPFIQPAAKTPIFTARGDQAGN